MESGYGFYMETQVSIYEWLVLLYRVDFLWVDTVESGWYLSKISKLLFSSPSGIDLNSRRIKNFPIEFESKFINQIQEDELQHQKLFPTAMNIFF